MRENELRNIVVVFTMMVMLLVNGTIVGIAYNFEHLIRVDGMDVAGALSTDNGLASSSAKNLNLGFPFQKDGKEIPNAFGDLLGLNSFMRDSFAMGNRSFSGIGEYDSFIVKDDDSMELIIGVDYTKSWAYNSIVDMVIRSQGEVVNTISIKDKVIAVVADIPLNAFSSFKEKMNGNPTVRYIEPNMKRQVFLAPNDPYWNLQWGPQKIEADWAWNTTRGSSDILVAVVDTGIDYTHPDLAGNYVNLGYDWANNDAFPLDDFGHGTHCAGIIAATINNSIGIAGLAQVKIMAEKVFDYLGYASDDWIAKGIIHAVNSGADIISMSFGGYGHSQLLYEAIKYAYDNGVLLVAAAGNDNVNLKSYPAAYDEVIAVAATDQNDNRAVWDPYHASNWGDWIELAAPGSDIYSTTPTYNVTLNDYGFTMNYSYMSGTSMACPHVAGVAALIWSQYPDATRDWVRLRLRYTVDDLGDPGFDEYYGYGRINARNAVEQALPDHDLLIFDLNRPKFIKLEESVTFNVSVLNFGVNDESNVEVRLLVDDSPVDSKFVDFVQRFNSTTVSLSYTFAEAGIHNVTYYVVPVSGETEIQNNQMTELLYVVTPPSERNWILLSTDSKENNGCDLKSIYGQVVSDIIYFKVEFYWNWTTINDIDTGILIDADQDPTTGLPDKTYLYQDTEIGADYIIVVGWEATEMWKWNPDIRQWDIGNPIPLAYLEAPENSSTFIVGVFFADVETSGIVDCAVADVMSDWDWMPNSGYFTWIMIRNEHELAVSLKTPQYLQPGENALVNATVYNLGLNNETNVEIRLIINGTTVKNETLAELPNGTCYMLTFPWTPTEKGTYNVTAYTPPVPNENFTLNNAMTRMVNVRPPLINPQEGQYAKYTIKSYYGQITGYLNLTYDHYTEPYKIYVTIQEKMYGDVFTGWMIVNTMTRYVEEGVWASLWYPGWIETDIDIGSTINLLYSTARVNGTKMWVVGPRAIDCWEIPYTYFYPYLFWYDRLSGLWIRMEFTNLYTGELVELMLVDTNVPVGTQYEHDLGVTLEAPSRLQPGESSMLNVTVYNVGLNTESNVNVSLLINGTILQSRILTELANGASSTMNCLWTPTVEAKYNVTAYVLPVSGEDITINNVATSTVWVKTIKGRILFDQTHFTDYISQYYMWITNLIDSGYVIDTLTESPITSSSLRNYDVLIIPQARSSYSSSETSVIQNFVLNGGGLIVIGDDAPDIYTSLTSFASISWKSGGYGGYTNDITPHPVTEGVETAYFDIPLSRLVVSSKALDLIRDSGGYIMLAVSKAGKGVVICLADENSIDDFDITYADNLQLAINMVNFIVEVFPPTASFTYSPRDPYVGETVMFNASASYDIDGTIVSYLWDFGDGTTGNGVITTHVYSESGTYIVTLTVVDDEGLNATFTANVTVTRTTLDVQVEAGYTYLRGDTAEFYIAVSSLGKPVDAEINATLYYDGSAYEDLSATVERISSGLYRIVYQIPAYAPLGAYSLIIEANYLTLKGINEHAISVVVDATPLDVKIDVGTLHFIGEIAEFYAQTTLKGHAINATYVNAILYGPNGEIAYYHYPTNITVIATGFYKIVYTIPGDAAAGTYTLVMNANYVDNTVQAFGTSFKCFLISQTLTATNAHIDEIKDGIATIIMPDLGLIKLNLTAMNVTLEKIFLQVTAINDTTATIQTILGTVNGTITEMKGNMATIVVPGLGQIQTDISGLTETQESWTVPQHLILVFSFVAAVCALLSTAMLLKIRKTAKTVTE